MKTQLFQTAVAALTLAAAGYAQSAQELKVTVGFDFVAGSRTLPAGQYTVSQPPNSSAVVIRGMGVPRGAVVLANKVESPGRQEIGKLVFHRYGDRYFLAEVWETGRTVGRQIPKTPQERKARQNSREDLATIFVAAH